MTDNLKKESPSTQDTNHIIDDKRPLKTIHLWRIHRDRMKRDELSANGGVQ